MSGATTGAEVDARAFTDHAAAAASGVPHGELLLHFAEAAVEAGPGVPGGPREDPGLVEARRELRQALGCEALVDAAGVVAQFQRMDRIADATVPLDPAVDWLTADLRREIGIDRFAAAASTPRSTALKRALSGVLRRGARAGLGLARRFRRP